MWMEFRRGKRRNGSVAKMALLITCLFSSLFLFSISALLSLDIRSLPMDSYTQGSSPRRRRLSSPSDGPGSYPPRCTSKCGACTPCYPVHVPVPPGTRFPTEYYPEAWRCRCGNRLYMP